MQPGENQSPPEVTPVQAARLIPAGAVCRLCGGVTTVTIYRWINRPDLAFPKPIKIGARSFWREFEVLGWIAARGVAA